MSSAGEADLMAFLSPSAIRRHLEYRSSLSSSPEEGGDGINPATLRGDVAMRPKKWPVTLLEVGGERCIFQRDVGLLTSHGLFFTSTVTSMFPRWQLPSLLSHILERNIWEVEVRNGRSRSESKERKEERTARNLPQVGK